MSIICFYAFVFNNISYLQEEAVIEWKYSIFHPIYLVFLEKKQGPVSAVIFKYNSITGPLCWKIAIFDKKKFPVHLVAIS